MSKPIGTTQIKPSAHKMNDGIPAIKMMDKIYKAQAKEKRDDLERYNQLCGPIVTTKTKITIKTTKILPK
jgi:hypothetical protein